ncbi:MAG: aldo/keto reductase [Gammaproteobacteria bacterium]|nr:aldo/keto reductase [Gammaproteobacteria bacterium]
MRWRNFREVLRQLPDLGGKIVDTARIYGSSEEVIGSIVESLGNRDKLFLATKTPMNGDLSDIAGAVDLAFTRMKVKKLDLIQVHNFYGTDQFVAEFRKRKDAGQVRYMGVSTSTDNQYDQLADAMRKYPLDFIQVDYSIDNRSAADNILPLAQERGIAVLVNMPFGGRRNAASTFSKVAKRELPDWAGEIDATSWAQVFLKYCVSHPSVTAAIPGTTKPHHLLDNQGGARGRLPDAAMRKEIEKYWDSL